MKHPFELPELSYDYSALEPYIDAQTMEIHHCKHHQAYIDKLNMALEPYEDLQTQTLAELLKNLAGLPEDIRGAVQNHGGGHYNHALFWKIMSPTGGQVTEKFESALEKNFQSVEAFKETFTQAAMGQFGSGWAWLAKDGQGRLSVVSTPNQNNPISDGLVPILGLDVWEHAYYLNYQNRRADYIKAWWAVVDWTGAEENLWLTKVLHKDKLLLWI